MTSTESQPLPSVTPAPLASATLAPATQTLTAPCEDSAKLTDWTRNNLQYDVTETEKPLAPNETFLMSWTLQNTGTCTWNSIYQMYLDSGTPLTPGANSPVLPVGETVAPGRSLTVTITMTAPSEDGEYQSAFRLQNDKGEAVATYGVITRVGTGSPPSASQSLSSPGDLRYTYDCTSGSVSIGLTWVDRANGEDGYRVYRGGTLVATLAARATSYSEIVPGSGTYNYTVAAFNAGGESPTTLVVSTTNC
jgi:hypothetical protein